LKTLIEKKIKRKSQNACIELTARMSSQKMRAGTVIVSDKMMREIVNDKCLMELVVAEGMTPEEWVTREMKHLQKRADAYAMSIEQYTNTFWTGEARDWK
jgi:hypothetical protein